MDTKTASKYTAKDFANLFAGIGVPANKIAWLVAQVAHETGDFKSRLLYDHNNGSGIVFTGKKTQKNATKGRPLPENPQYNYAIFATIKDWAIDYLRILNLKTKPIAANTPDEFVNRLKANGYFTANIDAYKKSFMKYLKKYGNIAPPIAGALLLFLGIGWLFLAK